MIESHVCAERVVLGARRRYVERANVAVHRRPGVHRPKRAADRCRITAARSDQKSAVSQSKYKTVRCTVTIKIGPEHDVPCRIDCLHWITGKRQAKALAAIDRIEEHDNFPPVSRSSREPSRVGCIGSRMVISKEGNLSGVVN